MAIDTTVQLPKSAQPGREIAALAPFYRDWTWSGTIREGGMGPGSPEMKGVGRATCHLIQGGLWYACDFEQDQHLPDGTFVLKWQLHWVTGWDQATGEYLACSADNNGPSLATYRGRIEGSRLIYESTGETLPRIRLTWALTYPDQATWRNEYTVDGSTWTLVEEYQMRVT